LAFYDAEETGRHSVLICFLISIAPKKRHGFAYFVSRSAKYVIF